ncbi:hypothetical protein BDW22DRAFT_1352777 [Trametopsis cervina]|nr:hypothetical protein BDW22DRAFT_1352777 [Trametopsis cervina]
MLRWCLSTVRTVGGRATTHHSAFRSASTLQFALQLTKTVGTRPAHLPCTTPAKPGCLTLSELAVTTVLSEEQGRAGNNVFVQSEATNAHTVVTQSSIDDSTGARDTIPHASADADLDASSPDHPAEVTPLSTHDSLAQLQQLLSATTTDDSLASNNIPTTNDIRSLYYSVKSHSQLHQLDSAQMSSLISLFGSLSLSTSGQPYSSIYAHPHTARFLEKASGTTYWQLVCQFGVDKGFLHQIPTDSDHFWLMQAQLASVRSGKGDAKPDARLHAALRHAGVHYRQLRTHTSHPDVHVPYISALLALPDDTGYPQALEALSHYIDSFPLTHESMRQLLWQLILRGSTQCTPDSQIQLLNAISRRASRRLQEVTPQSLGSNKRLDAPSMDAAQDSWNIEGLFDALTVATFGTTPSDRNVPEPVRMWALRFVSSLFRIDPAHPTSVDVAWKNLSLLALGNSAPDTPHRNLLSPSPGNEQSTDLQAIYVLTRLERLIYGPAGHEVRKELTEAARKAIGKVAYRLWCDWSASVPDNRTEAAYPQCTILSSFIHVAGCVGDSSLLDACRSRVEAHLSEKVNPLFVDSAPLLLRDYVSAAVSCGLGSSKVLEWASRQAPSHALANVVHGVLDRLAKQPLPPVYDFYVAASQAGIPVDVRIIATLSRNLVESGYPERGLLLLQHVALDSAQRVEVLLVALKSFAANPRDPRYSESHLCDMLWNMTLDVLSHAQSEAFRSAVEGAIIGMLSIGRPLPVIPVINRALQISSTYFQPAGLRTIISLLVRHRQYQPALDVLSKAPQEVVAGLEERTILSMARRGAHSLARLAASRMSGPESPSQTLLKDTKYRYKSPSSGAALKVEASLYNRVHDASSIALGIHMLLSAGRIHAARTFFEKECEKLSPQSRTAIGNDIIHQFFEGHPLRPQRHRMRGALRLLKDLECNCSFIPDRVTFNILTKGAFQLDHKLDTKSILTLFDRLVLSGYPTGGLYDVGVAPFDANSVMRTPAIPLPDDTLPLSFAKHVRPLYKTFIRALYLRRDTHGAHKILGILKAAEAEWAGSLGKP